ncbi:MAG: hypothetical protein FWE38_03115 [Firmicutes bacterium]|nr:hypothetical protein [Bacillota bacterium]
MTPENNIQLTPNTTLKELASAGYIAASYAKTLNRRRIFDLADVAATNWTNFASGLSNKAKWKIYDLAVQAGLEPPKTPFAEKQEQLRAKKSQTTFNRDAAYMKYVSEEIVTQLGEKSEKE